MNAATTVTLLVGILTVLMSGLSSAVVTYLLNRRKDRFEFMREKAEQRAGVE